MNQPLLVSIIINNYNYGRFLSQAIDSALRQTYSPIEIIVVDDGSTDNSRAIIAAYNDRVIPLLKENRGQASAFNAGFACSQGEVIIFLDADDVLLPTIAERVAAVFKTNPEVAKVQYRLEVIEASGAPTGLVRPPWQRPMPNGDLRQQVLTFPDDVTWQPTSGNAFAARILRHIFPMPEDVYRICADYYLSNLSPLLGIVVSLEEVGAYYRVHGTNNHDSSTMDLNQTREIITRTLHTHGYIKTLADSLDLIGFPAEAADVPAITFLAHRIVSLKLDPARHPIKEDKLLPLFARGVSASFGRFDLSWPAKCLYSLWFAVLLFVPGPAVRWLAQKFLYSETRGRVGKVVSLLQRMNAATQSKEPAQYGS